MCKFENGAILWRIFKHYSNIRSGGIGEFANNVKVITKFKKILYINDIN